MKRDPWFIIPLLYLYIAAYYTYIMLSAVAHLRGEIIREVDKALSKGKKMSTADVGISLDHLLEHYEGQHGDCIPEAEFNDLIDEINDELLRECKVYRAGDRESYIQEVRDRGLISQQEAYMKKCILRDKDRKGAIRVTTLFVDTEFPYDVTTGMYIL